MWYQAMWMAMVSEGYGMEIGGAAGVWMGYGRLLVEDGLPRPWSGGREVVMEWRGYRRWRWWSARDGDGMAVAWCVNGRPWKVRSEVDAWEPS